jgi:hypothetical protein
MKLQLLPFLLAATASTLLVSCNANVLDDYLRKESRPASKQSPFDEAQASLLEKLVKRIESLEMRIDELEDTIEIFQTTHTGRHLEADPECVIKYNSATGMCHTNHTFAFDYHVEMMDGVTAAGDAEFAGKLYMMEGGEVRGGTLWSDCPTMFTKGLEVRGGLIAFNTTTRMGNLTVDGTTVSGKTTFMDKVDFKNDVEFFDKVEFNRNVDFKGEKVDFYSEVTFENDVAFEDDAAFKDDVAIYGPTSSDDSSTDFKVYGYVDVDFKQKKAMDVYPVTRFHDDVKLVRGRSSKSSKAHQSSRRIESSSDYSSESYDTIPRLIVEGDIITEKNLIVENNLDVGGTATFHTGVDIEGDLTVTGTGDFTAVTTDGLTVEGTSTLKGATTVTTGGLEVEGGDVVVANGGITATDVTVTTGSLSVDKGDLEVVEGDVSVGGDLFVEGAAGGNSAWDAPTIAPVV